MKYSIVIPAKNEASGLRSILPQICEQGAAEIIVVSDGSTDDTEDVCSQYNVTLIKHPYSKGNGASVKTGVLAAKEETILLMDGDGQHKPSDIQFLLKEYMRGFDMVVGARNSGSSQANIARGFGNKLYNWFSSWMVGHKIDDLTSGFRVVNKSKFLQFISLLPNGFSYPTTITMAFFRAGFSVSYISISMPTRIGKSHLKIWKDGVKFLLIIFKVGTLYSPLKIFFPFSAAYFSLGLGYYCYTFVMYTKFTNMSALLFTTAVLIFLIGLVSEQITNLVYK